MRFTYQTWGTCSKFIEFNVENDIVSDVRFIGGCNGNLQAVSRLVEGLTTQQVIDTLRGINCNGKGTSCGDQLSLAVEEARASMAK